MRIVFVGVTIFVTGGSSLAFDARAFAIAADDVRAPWLDAAARVVTNLGPIAIVGSAVLVGGAGAVDHHARVRAGAVVAGAALVTPPTRSALRAYRYTAYDACWADDRKGAGRENERPFAGTQRGHRRRGGGR